MATGIFRKGRRLQKGYPAFIHCFIDHSYRPHNIASVFFIPAGNKSIIQCNRCQGIAFSTFHNICFALQCCNGSYTHPMSTGRDLFISKHHVSGMFNHKRIVIPVTCNCFLFIGEIFSNCIYFFQFFIKNAVCIGTIYWWPCWHKL